MFNDDLKFWDTVALFCGFAVLSFVLGVLADAYRLL